MPVKEYDDLFVRLLPSVVRAHDPKTPYIRCSGHTPGKRRDRDHSFDIDRGDSHLWWVLRGHDAVVRSIEPGKLAKLDGDALSAAKWNIVGRAAGGLTPHQQRSLVPRFCSEIGKVSLPDVRTIAAFTEPGDRNVLSPVMEHHQQGSNQWMLGDVLTRFMPPPAFADLVTVSQLSHGEHFRWLVESWRRSKPRNMGALHWTANDCWPAVEWATVDWYHRRKASFYVFKRFFSPVLVTGEDFPKEERCDVYLVSDLPRPLRGRFDWTLTDLDGRILGRGGRTETAEALKSRMLCRLAFPWRPTEALLFLDWETEGELSSHNLVLFCQPRALCLRKPTYDVAVTRQAPRVFDVTVKTDRPALYTALVARADRDADWSDNYLHLRPGKTATVTVRTAEDMSAARLRKSLTCRSLADLY
jgi:beta-mannosidase